MEEFDQMEEIDLFLHVDRFLKSLRHTWLLVLALGLLCGMGKYAWDRLHFVPQYVSKAIFSVSSVDYSNDIFVNSTFFDTAAAEEIVDTFPYLLTTEFMQDLIKAELGMEEIPGKIKAVSIAETNMFELRVTGADPQQVHDVLEAAIAAYPRASVYMLDHSRIDVLEAPTVPTAPYNAFSPLQTLTQGSLIGILVGLVWTLALSVLNQSITNEDELKKIINLPLLAILPQVRVKKRRKNANTAIRADEHPGMMEAVRGLRTKVRRTLDENGGKTVLLTSTLPGEGKSTTAINLALALADEGHSTVLLDADLRNQTIGRMMNAGIGTPGLIGLMKRKDLQLDATRYTSVRRVRSFRKFWMW